MDDVIRTAVFRWLGEQTGIYGDALPRSLLENGFLFNGRRVTLIGPSGIWKPKGFKDIPLSITSTPKGPYDDSISPDGLLVYRYRGNDPNHRDNVGLREAMRTRTPLIYFFGVAVGRYLPIWPIFIIRDDPEHLQCFAAIDPAYAMKGFDPMDEELLYNSTDESVLSIRRYILGYTKKRLHQSAFREQVISAYHEKCSLCMLKHRELLDAAHIIPDGEEGGDPVVQNGLSLCKIHHAAFDNNIIGISPDFEIELRRDILDEIDGPMLRYGLQELHHSKLILPSRKADWPDRERLEIRYNRFRRAG